MVSQNRFFLLEYTVLLFVMLDVGGEEEKEYFLRVPPFVVQRQAQRADINSSAWRAVMGVLWLSCRQLCFMLGMWQVRSSCAVPGTGHVWEALPDFSPGNKELLTQPAFVLHCASPSGKV